MEEPDLHVLEQLVEAIRADTASSCSAEQFKRTAYGLSGGYTGIVKTLLLAYDNYKKALEQALDDYSTLGQQYSDDCDKIDKALGIDPEFIPKTIEKTIGLINQIKLQARNAEKERDALKAQNKELKKLYITTEQQLLEAKDTLRTAGMSTNIGIDGNAFEAFEKEHKKALDMKKQKEK